jgi:outer membrane biosynthesis protein TonB
MVTPQNGSKVAVAELLGGTATDSKNKTLKFQQEKDTSIPAFTAKGKDGNTYGFSLADIVATVTVSPEVNKKELRKQGFPMPKDEAKEADNAIKEEKKAAKEARKAAREDAKKRGVMSEAEAERQEKEEEEAEKEEKEQEETKESSEEEKPSAGLRESSSGRRGR